MYRECSLNVHREPAELPGTRKRDIDSFCDYLKFNAIRYRKMKDLFEPPYNYEEMKQTLEKYRVLFILGEPHLGKTYTALNMLYDYYNQGLSVSFHSEWDMVDMHLELAYWRQILECHTVIYFKDPFGNEEPENVQAFALRLERILKSIQYSKKMVIITSPLNVFNQMSHDDLPQRVELKKTSYDTEKRKKIIDNYITVYNPAWKDLVNERVNGNTLKEYIAEELTEPHTISVFFEKSLNIKDMSLLDMVEKSKDILKIFKGEIEACSTQERIFFVLCYIFERDWRGFENAERCYSVVLKEFDLDIQGNDFDSLLEKYDHRIDIYESFFWSRIQFSHPEFSKAIEESFSEYGSVIGKILKTLARDQDCHVRETVAVATRTFEIKTEVGTTKTVERNLEDLSYEYRRILRVMKDKCGYIKRNVAEDIGYNFEKLPDKCRRVLFSLARDRDRYVRGVVAETVGYNFQKLPDEYRKILFSLARGRDGYVTGMAAETVGYNFKRLSDEYRRILFLLARDKNKYMRGMVAETVGYNFEKLTDEYRRILRELAADEDSFVRMEVANTIGCNFRKLPEEYRKILFSLAEDSVEYPEKAGAQTDEHGRFAEGYRKILCALTRDKSWHVRKKVAETIEHNFEKLPDEYRRILITLSEDKAVEVRKTVALAICRNFETLPEEYQKIFKKFESDIPVLNTLKKWIKKQEKYEFYTEMIEILRREVNL